MTRISKNKYDTIARRELSDRQIFDLTGLANSDSEDELYIEQPAPAPAPKKRGRPAKKSLIPRLKGNKKTRTEGKQIAKPSHTPAQVLDLVDKAADALAHINVQDFLEIQGPESTDAVEGLRAKCETLANSLQTPDTPKKTHAGDVPSTIEHYGKLFVLREPGNLIYLLSPLEVFKGIPKIYTRRKVFGFIRTAGDKFPLMFALPGWKRATEDHQRMLDSTVWTEEVLKWGNFHNHKFRKYGIDQWHKQEEGSFYACHAEPKLMLWFACHQLLKNNMGVEGNISFQIGELWKLGHLKKAMEAEIVLSEHPCKPCVAFQEKIEEYTGIKFTITVLPNLGILKAGKNSQGYKTYPLNAVDDSTTDDDGDDNEHPFQTVGPDFEIISNTEARVEIRGRGLSGSFIEGGERETNWMTQTPATTSTLQSFKKKFQYHYHEETPPLKLKRGRVQREWDNDYTPTKSRTKVPPTPPESYFNSEAVNFATRLESKKRRRGLDRDGSPSAPKTRRHRHST